MAQIFGSISHATLRPEDLLPTFLREAQARFPNWQEPNTHTQELPVIQDAYQILEVLDRVDDDAMRDAFYATEYAGELVNDLQDKLGEDLPPYVYFGANEGDGSDFGYWFSSMSFEDDARFGTVVKLSDASELDDAIANASEDAEYFAVVNDHGNVTLYDKEQKEIWSIV
jgi:hypothetical protein